MKRIREILNKRLIVNKCIICICLFSNIVKGHNEALYGITSMITLLLIIWDCVLDYREGHKEEA